MRVKLQSKLRKMSEVALDKLEVDGYHCKWAEIAEKYVPTVKDAIMALTWDEFLELMVDNYEMEVEQARRIFCKKHDLEYTPAPAV